MLRWSSLVLVLGLVGSTLPLKAFAESASSRTEAMPDSFEPAAIADWHFPAGINPILREEQLTLLEENARSIAQLSVPPCDADSEVATTVAPMPFAEALDSLQVVYPQTAPCCRICTVGQACGNTCISARFTCHVGLGCACNAGGFGGGGAVLPPTPARPSVALVSQSSYPRLRVGASIELTVVVETGLSPLIFDGDLEMRVTNSSDLAGVLRGWDEHGLLAYNRSQSGSLTRHTFKGLIQGLSAGTRRVRVGLFHRTYGQVGPDGVFWDVTVDANSSGYQLSEGWHSKWAGQSPYLAMAPGQVAQFWIRFANAGTETWQRGVWGRQVNLALNGDNKEPFRLGMAVNWLWDDRIATTANALVPPGEVAEFRFAVRAPVVRGLYALNLRPVVDGLNWLEDEGVFWVIEVR